MSNFQTCSVCNEYDLIDMHKCKDIYYFKHEDWGEEPQEIRANSFEGAAEKFAELYNEDGDYALMERTIKVVISDGKIQKTFNVSAEPSINYSVDEL